MAPKKDAPDGESNTLLVGFTDKETKLLAAAFVSCVGTDKYDYDLMATLTKNTAGSLKKMWPPVKKKASENHPSFASLLGQASTTAAIEPKTFKKRKASEETREASCDVNTDAISESDKADSNIKSPAAKKVKKAPAARDRGRPKKEVKKEEPESEVGENKAIFTETLTDTNGNKVNSEKDSANGEGGAEDEEI